MKNEFESDLDKALNSLKNQGIPIGDAGLMPGDGFVFDVNGFLLTGAQILRLRADGELDSQGIRNFDTKEKECIERDVKSALENIPPEELRLWNASKVCDYINRKFDRIHSVGQVTAVLNRLKVEYKRV